MTYRVKGGWINTHGSHWAVQEEAGRHPDMSSQGKEKDNYIQRMTGGGERGGTEMKTGPDQSPQTLHSSEHHT